MAVNRISPSKSERNLDQGQDSNSDQVNKREKWVAAVRYKPPDVEKRPEAKRIEKNDQTEWIRQNIKIKKCLDYEESEEKNICHCGKEKNKHASNVECEQNKSDTEPTNAFGEIQFDDAGKLTAKFVRIDSKTTKSSTILELMREIWKVEMPNLLISVAGSAKPFEESRLGDACQTSLKKAVQGTGTWIITGGRQEGVMKYIGKAVTTDKQRIITIGITPWGTIYNKHKLVKEQGSWPAKYPIDKSSLDPNHSHFILVDDGSQDRSHTEMNFRVELESAIAKIKSNTAIPFNTDATSSACQESTSQLVNENAIPSNTVAVSITSLESTAHQESKIGVTRVPLVLLVLEWDQTISETVNNALKRNTPVVIVKASNREANSHQTDSEIPEEISKNKLSQICEWNSGSGDFDIGLAILEALSKDTMNNVWDNMTNAMYQLKLAFAWDRIDIAKKNISRDTIIRMVHSLEDFIMTAILMDRMEFVELILENGFDLKKFLTQERLLELYSKILTKDFFNELLTKMRKTRKEEVSGMASVIRRKMNEKTIRLVEVKQLLQYLYGDSDLKFTRYDDHGKDTTGNGNEQTKADDDDPCLHLFIWSVLSNHQDMAKFFWRHGKDAMTAALFADALLYAMSRHIDDKDFKDQCEKHRLEFSNLAIGVLKECHNEDKKMAKDLLIQQSRWGEMSCILIAVNAKNKQFISQHACQDVFNNIWMGEIDQDNGSLCDNLKIKEITCLSMGSLDASNISIFADADLKLKGTELFINWRHREVEKLLLCIIIPPLILICITFKKKEDGEQARVDQETHNSVKTEPITRQPPPREKTNASVISEKTPSHEKTTVNYSVRERSKRINDALSKMIESGADTRLASTPTPAISLYIATVLVTDAIALTIEESISCRIIWQRIKSFYLAPVIIFFHNVISYMIFLGLYSYILISKFDRYLSWQEILLCVWVFTIFTQEIIQVCTTPAKDWRSRISNYRKDGWNILDIVTLLLFLFGMILRIFDHPQVTESAHIVLGVNLITFYLRLLHIFSVHRELGPKLVMIIQMVYNLASFFMILLVFIVAYGIASHAILYPHTEPSLETLTEIFRRPYWNIYGELMLDKIEGSVDCTNDPELYKTGTNSRCPTESGKYFVPVLMGVYMLMCNILLLNLLIAMFSFTFQKVQDNSYLYWSFQQYSLINEYANRPFLAPPLIIITHLLWLIRRVACCQIKCCEVNAAGHNALLNPIKDCKKLLDWEDEMAKKFYEHELKHNSSHISEEVLPNLEKRMETIEKQLNWIVTTMKENNRGAQVGSVSHVQDIRV